jgi:hypothetical protein
MDKSVWRRGVGPRALTAMVAAGVGLASGVAAAREPGRASASALLAVDQNRATVIERIVAQWGEPLAQSSAALGAEPLRAMLEGLRADHLLAASLAGTLDGLRNALATAATSTAAVRDNLVRAKALGDPSNDLVYTPINPCRIVDTRTGGGGLLGNNDVRDWNVVRPGGNFVDQGGENSDCAIPAGPAAVLANLVATGSSQPGVLFASAFNQPAPTASTLNYAGGQTIANAVIVPIAIGQAKELHVFVSTGTHVVVDVLGYFRAPDGSGGQFFKQGGNAFGTTATLGTTDDNALEIEVDNQRVMRYQPNATSPNIVGGHPNNSVSDADYAQTVAGGGSAGSDCYDPATGTFTGSCANHTTSSLATVGGGIANAASGSWSTVVGGSANRASGNYATVAGGHRNFATGDLSFAAGHSAHADRTSCALFGLWSTFGQAFTCQNVSNLFRVGADHGFDVSYYSRLGEGGSRFVYIGDFYAGDTIRAWSGAHLTDGGAWTNASDRDVKENFAPIDAQDILERVRTLAVTQWNYRAEPGIRRIGPTGQDFHVAFGLGGDDKSISTVDASGVALAAIQGLHQRVQEKEARIVAQDERIAALEEALEELRRRVEAWTRTAERRQDKTAAGHPAAALPTRCCWQ